MKESEIRKIIKRVARKMRDDLVHRNYKQRMPNGSSLSGLCYIVCEVYCQLFPVYKPQHLDHEGVSHWFLRHSKTEKVVDLTSEQFDTPIPYDQGRGRGFLSPSPSKRAGALLEAVKVALKAETKKKKTKKPASPITYIGYTLHNRHVCEYTDLMPTRSAALHAVKTKHTWLSGEASCHARKATNFDPSAIDGIRIYSFPQEIHDNFRH